MAALGQGAGVFRGSRGLGFGGLGIGLGFGCLCRLGRDRGVGGIVGRLGVGVLVDGRLGVGVLVGGGGGFDVGVLVVGVAFAGGGPFGVDGFDVAAQFGVGEAGDFSQAVGVLGAQGDAAAAGAAASTGSSPSWLRWKAMRSALRRRVSGVLPMAMRVRSVSMWAMVASSRGMGGLLMKLRMMATCSALICPVAWAAAVSGSSGGRASPLSVVRGPRSWASATRRRASVRLMRSRWTSTSAQSFAPMSLAVVRVWISASRAWSTVGARRAWVSRRDCSSSSSGRVRLV